jgi:SAM-dependent methyltransferase
MMDQKINMPAKRGGWNAIYSEAPEKYTYYNLNQPHENLAEVIGLLKTRKVKKVLDLGCGVGRNLVPLLLDGFEATGIDEAKEGIKALQVRLNQLSLTAHVMTGRFQQICMPSGYFDAVLSIQTLNHGYETDIAQGFSEMSRVLKPHGLVFITLPGRIAKGKVRYCLVKTARQVEDHTYIPMLGDEIGIPHHIFNLALIEKYMRNYRQLRKIWADERDYYCILAEKIN